jgi:hypothetical protein
MLNASFRFEASSANSSSLIHAHSYRCLVRQADTPPDAWAQTTPHAMSCHAFALFHSQSRRIHPRRCCPNETPGSPSPAWSPGRSTGSTMLHCIRQRFLTQHAVGMSSQPASQPATSLSSAAIAATWTHPNASWVCPTARENLLVHTHASECVYSYPGSLPSTHNTHPAFHPQHTACLHPHHPPA